MLINNPATLYIIPTPIGNLEDITLRSLQLLKQVDVLFCEDTRETRKLLQQYNIEKPLISNHKYNEKAIVQKIIEQLNMGYQVGLVSDRGTPGISDPGFIAVKEVIHAGYTVSCLPGATAVIPALVMSGISPHPFCFFGFLDAKESARRKQLGELKKISFTLVFYESPHRLLKTIESMYEVFGNRFFTISREISKKFEETYRGYLKESLPIGYTYKGEFVIVVEGCKEVQDYSEISIQEHVHMYMKEGKNTNEAIKAVAKDRNVTKKIVYDEYHHLKKGGIII